MELSMMRKWAIAMFHRPNPSRLALCLGTAILVTILTIGSAGPGFAEPPFRFSEVLDITVPAPVTSAACGFPVLHRITGTFTVTLFKDGGDLVVREIDGAKGARDTWFAPTQGTSYSYQFNGSTRFDYPEGGTLGAPATLTFDQMLEKVPGRPAAAGMVVYQGVVVFVTPEGIPVVDTDPVPILIHGSFGSSPYADRCAALAAP